MAAILKLRLIFSKSLVYKYINDCNLSNNKGRKTDFLQIYYAFLNIRKLKIGGHFEKKKKKMAA